MISNYVSPTNVVMNIPDLMLDISSFCDYKELGALQCVSKQWYLIAGDNRLWQDLFACHFPQKMLPKTQCKEAFRNRLAVICPKTLSEVTKAIMTFVCQLKWNTKSRLVCEFPREPLCFFIIEQGFGPKRGTKEGFEGTPEEVKCLEYNGHIFREEDYKEFYYEKFTQCPETGIPLRVSSSGVSPSGWFSITGLDYLSNYRITIGYLSTPLEAGVNECVEIDVGWGNTLGYCSEMNDWKSPFKLHCVMGIAGQPVWTGLFPKEYRFKFVLIDAKGRITWERAEGNRDLFYYSSSLKTDCAHKPIQF
jgi:F-box-like